MPKNHDLNKVRLWARMIIANKDDEIAKLKVEKKILKTKHMILAELIREWIEFVPDKFRGENTTEFLNALPALRPKLRDKFLRSTGNF